MEELERLVFENSLEVPANGGVLGSKSGLPDCMPEKNRNKKYFSAAILHHWLCLIQSFFRSLTALCIRIRLGEVGPVHKVGVWQCVAGRLGRGRSVPHVKPSDHTWIAPSTLFRRG